MKNDYKDNTSINVNENQETQMKSKNITLNP